MTADPLIIWNHLAKIIGRMHENSQLMVQNTGQLPKYFLRKTTFEHNPSFLGTMAARVIHHE